MIWIFYDGNSYKPSNLYFLKYYVTIWMTQSIKIDVMHRKRKSWCLQRPSLWLCFPFLSSFYKVNIDRIDWFFDHLIDIFDTLETQNLILSLFFHFQYSNNCATRGQQRLRYITISSSSSLSYFMRWAKYIHENSTKYDKVNRFTNSM